MKGAFGLLTRFFGVFFVVLVLIGVKIIWNFGLSKELGWAPYLEPHWALMGTLALIGGQVVLSSIAPDGKAYQFAFDPAVCAGA